MIYDEILKGVDRLLQKRRKFHWKTAYALFSNGLEKLRTIIKINVLQV